MILHDLEQLKQLAERLKQDGKTIVWTNGCFDLLHHGHLVNLQSAKGMGDVLIVGINGDASPYFHDKPGRPIQHETARAELLHALKPVDHVFIFQDETPLQAIRAVLPHVLVKGGDYRAEDLIGYDVVTEHGGRVEIVPLVPGASTTDLIQKILKTYVPDTISHSKKH